MPKGEFAEYGQSNDEEHAHDSGNAAEDAKARRRAERAALRAQRGRQGTRRGQKGAEWDGLPYSDALLQEGLDHARTIAEKRIKGEPRSADDWRSTGFLFVETQLFSTWASDKSNLSIESSTARRTALWYSAPRSCASNSRLYPFVAAYAASRCASMRHSRASLPALASSASFTSASLSRRLCECYAQKTALRSEHEARKYFAIVKAYRKLEDSLQGTRKPTESELLESLDAHTATQGMGRETMLDILDRGSDGMHKVVFSTATPHGDEERTPRKHAAALPTAKLAVGSAGLAGIVDAACATNPSSSAALEGIAGEAGSASCATEARSGSTASSASSTSKTAVNDPEALIFRNGSRT